jgi:hypothetical protein
VAADAGFNADVELHLALGARLREAARLRLLNFDFGLALLAELLGTDGVGAVEGALRMDAVSGVRCFAADGTEFASRLRNDHRFWLKNAHMAPI